MPIGDTLKDCMDAKGIDFIIGVHSIIINGIMSGKLRLTESIAKKIESATGVVSTFWMNLDGNYQEGKARGLKELAFQHD